MGLLASAISKRLFVVYDSSLSSVHEIKADLETTSASGCEVKVLSDHETTIGLVSRTPVDLDL